MLRFVMSLILPLILISSSHAADTWFEDAWPECDTLVYFTRENLAMVHPAGVYVFVIKKHQYHKANEGDDYFSERHVYWTDLERFNAELVAKEKSEADEQKRKAGL